MPEISVLILAAGASTRMGQPKQLLPWKNTTLLGHAIDQAKKVSKNVWVVLGANAEKVNTVIPENIKTIINLNWKSGLGTSIAFGINKLQITALPEAVLVMLADQPLIDAGYLNSMVATHEKNPSKIVATDYKGSAGVPALFPKGYFSELQSLSSDFGAKQLMKKYSDDTIRLDAQGKTIDLDTTDNYNDFFTKYGMI